MQLDAEENGTVGTPGLSMKRSTVHWNTSQMSLFYGPEEARRKLAALKAEHVTNPGR